MLHSVVGLAAVMTSIASVMADLDHATTLHLVTAYLGVVIGQSIGYTYCSASSNTYLKAESRSLVLLSHS